MLRRGVSISLLFCFLSLGSGLALHLHEKADERVDAAVAAAAKAAGLPQPEHHDHDDGNCPIHAQLHMLMGAGDGPPVLLLPCLSVALVVLPPVYSLSIRIPLVADCRGPPA